LSVSVEPSCICLQMNWANDANQKKLWKAKLWGPNRKRPVKSIIDRRADGIVGAM
jgi:hypothetical protein